MNLPLVSRRAYDVLLDRLNATEAALRVNERRCAEAMQDAQKERADLVARYDALAHSMGSMVREGMTVPPKYPEMKGPDPLPKAIERAISTVAPNQHDPIRAQLERLAWDLLGEPGASDEVIAARILEGEEVAL